MTTESPIHPAASVRRSASVMGDRQDVNLVVADQVRQVVGKSGHRHASHVQIRSQPVNWHPGLGPSHDRLDGTIDRGDKGKTQAGMTLFVPACGIFELSRRLVDEVNPLAHRVSSSVSL